MRSQQSGQLSDAEAIYRQIIEAVPSNSDAWHYLGILHHQRKNPSLAIAHVKRAIELNPKVARYHSALGLIFLLCDSLENAERSCRQALDLDPSFVEAWENLSQVLFAAGDTEQAQNCAQEVAKITGDPIARFNALVMLPAIYNSSEEERMWRKRLLRSLDELVSIDFLLDPIQGSRARATLFYLSYQGLNDRLVHETCAFLCSGSGQDYVKPRKGRRDSNRN